MVKSAIPDVVKGVIFDFDGTLVDSMFIWDTFGENYLRVLGKEPKENLTEAFRKLTLEQAAEYYREHYGVTLSVKEIVDGLNEMLSQIYRSRVMLKKGVREFLEKLQAQGVKMCIATVTDRRIVCEVLKKFGVLEFFSAILTCSEIGYGKETPHIYRMALKILGVQKEETIVFEDTLPALITAKNDGFKVAAVYDRYEERQAEIQKIADYYVTDFDDISI